jgi:hypothetical protein
LDSTNVTFGYNLTGNINYPSIACLVGFGSANRTVNLTGIPLNGTLNFSYNVSYASDNIVSSSLDIPYSFAANGSSIASFGNVVLSLNPDSAEIVVALASSSPGQQLVVSHVRRIGSSKFQTSSLTTLALSTSSLVSSSSDSSSDASKSKGDSGLTTGLIILIALTGGIALVSGAAAIYYSRNRKRAPQSGPV